MAPTQTTQRQEANRQLDDTFVQVFLQSACHIKHEQSWLVKRLWCSGNWNKVQFLGLVPPWTLLSGCLGRFSEAASNCTKWFARRLSTKAYLIYSHAHNECTTFHGCNDSQLVVIGWERKRGQHTSNALDLNSKSSSIGLNIDMWTYRNIFTFGMWLLK